MGALRYDPGVKALFVLLLCALTTIVRVMTWSISSSWWTTLLVTPAVMFAFQTVVALLQLSEAKDLQREVAQAIEA